MRAWTLPLILLLAACSQAPVASESPPPASDPPATAKNEPVMCKEPRPQVCTMIYQPVCATRDTGMQCYPTGVTAHHFEDHHAVV